MKVILLSDLRHRGKRGETVEVKPGFARNFLLPQGLALVANAGNQKYFEQQRKKIEPEARRRARRRSAPRRRPRGRQGHHSQAGRARARRCTARSPRGRSPTP